MLIKRFATTVVPALALLGTCSGIVLSGADLVELHLRSGALVKGDLVSQDAEKVVVKSSMVAKSGKAMSITMTYKRDDIAELVDIGDPDVVYGTRSKAAMSAADHAALAVWCTQMGMSDRALEQAEHAVDLDATQENAAKLALDAGFVKADGKWVKEADLLAGQGKVRYQGKVMTIAEADELKAEAKKLSAAADAQQAAADKGSAVAYDDRLIADLKKRAPLLDADIVKAQAAVNAAEATVPRLAAAKTALDAAQANLTKARANPPIGNGTAGGPNNNANSYLTPYTQAVDTAQKAYSTAKTDAANADVDLPNLRIKLGSLLTEKKTLTKKLEELTAKRVDAAKEQDQAKIDAAKATADASAKPAGTPAATPAAPGAPSPGAATGAPASAPASTVPAPAAPKP